MQGHEPFLQAIEENPTDDAPLLMFADWCAERGEGDFSYALRWMVQEKKRPRFLSRLDDRWCYGWLGSRWLGSRWDWKDGYVVLPAVVFGQVVEVDIPPNTNDSGEVFSSGETGFGMENIYYASWEWAVWWLALRLKALRISRGEETGPWPVFMADKSER